MCVSIWNVLIIKGINIGSLFCVIVNAMIYDDGKVHKCNLCGGSAILFKVGSYITVVG